MDAVAYPVHRARARALVIGHATTRGSAVAALESLGHEVSCVEDPYTAMVELCERRGQYQMLVLCLAGLYREELAIIPAVAAHAPEVEAWLAQTDGRAALTAEAVRLGAVGLVSSEGLHRMGKTGHETPRDPAPEAAADAAPEASDVAEADLSADGLLTAEELRALLEDLPPLAAPPARDSA